MSIPEKKSAPADNVNGHKTQDAEEVQIPVPWGHISGKLWGPRDQQPIVALHGWQDNAGSFDTLAALLSSHLAILAIELPGHGHSSHLPNGQFYYVFWDGLLLLRRIVKYYKWNKINRTYRLALVHLKHLPHLTCKHRIIHGKWWGPKGIQPILALHGRQDNAGSFDTLIPLLGDDVSVLCLDLPGHGLSSHYSNGRYYYVYWDGVMILRRIVKHFKWNKVKLLGHSLGGGISFLYAASYPDEVDFLISLDIASPSVRDITKTAAITGDQIDKFLKYEGLEFDNVPSYEYDEMIDVVESGYKGSVTREGAKILMKRGMHRAFEANRYYFSRDPKLKVALLGMLSMDLVLAYAARIKCAYLNIRAIPGMKFDDPENYHKVLDLIKLGSRKFQYAEVEGTHHVHLNNPERVAPIITNFIST